MVEFRSKKKENGKVIHYPLRKSSRKPFGESRDEALKEVLKLREENKRARLIETNRKYKLYAPYVSTLQESEAETGGEPPKEDNAQEAKTEQPKEGVEYPPEAQLENIAKKLQPLNELVKNLYMSGSFTGYDQITPELLKESSSMYWYDSDNNETWVGMLSFPRTSAIFATVPGDYSNRRRLKGLRRYMKAEASLKDLAKFVSASNAFEEKAYKYQRSPTAGEQVYVGGTGLIELRKPAGSNEITLKPFVNEYDTEVLKRVGINIPEIKVKMVNGPQEEIVRRYELGELHALIRGLYKLERDGKAELLMLTPETESDKSKILGVETREKDGSAVGFIIMSYDDKVENRS